MKKVAPCSYYTFFYMPRIRNCMGTISGAGTAYHLWVHLWFYLRFVLLNHLFVVLWTLACHCISCPSLFWFYLSLWCLRTFLTVSNSRHIEESVIWTWCYLLHSFATFMGSRVNNNRIISLRSEMYKSYLLTHVYYTRQLTLLAWNNYVHTHHTS
jgi:hypothetical protein